MARSRTNKFLDGVAIAAPTGVKEIVTSLTTFADDASYEAIYGAGAEGDLYFNTTIQMLRIYKNAAWENIDADELDYDNSSSGLTAQTVQAAIDEVEARVDETESDVADIRTTQGTSDGDTNLGTFTGNIISDNGTVKGGMQELETESEAQRTMSGTTLGSTDLGTFPGSTIADNETTKGALEDLEDGLEMHEAETDPHGATGNIFGLGDTPRFTSNEGIGVPAGTTAQRSGSAVAGELRFNTDSNELERYNGTSWGAVGGGGGGFEIQEQNSNFTAESDKWYLVRTGVTNITLPAGALGFALRVSDADRTWGTTSVTITPQAGESVQGKPNGEALELKGIGNFVQIGWDNAQGIWVLDDQGTETDSKQYTANQDARFGTENTTDTANVTIARTTTAANLPEESKGTAFEVSASGASIDGTDYAQWNAKFVWDDADTNVASGSLRFKGTGGWKFQAWNTTDNVAAGPETVEVTSDKTVTFEIYPAAEKTIVIRAIPTTANPATCYISGVTSEPVTSLSGSIDEDWLAIDSPVLDNAPTASEFEVYYKRNGDTATFLLFYENSATSASASDIEFDVSSNLGLTADESKIPGSGSKANVLGYASFFNSVNYSAFDPLYSFSTGSVKFRWNDSATNADLKGNNFATAGRSLGAKFSIPILEWNNSGTLTLSEAQQQNSRIRYYVGSTHSPSANSAIVFDTESTLVNKNGDWSISAGEITFPSKGTYSINFAFQYSSASGNTTIYSARNGTRETDIIISGTGLPNTNPNGSFLVEINDPATETISIRSSLALTGVVQLDQNSWIDVSRVADKTGTAIGLPFPNGILKLDTGNGHGSTGTNIRRYSNIREQSGDAFTYEDSATNGGTITINRDMIVSITNSDEHTSAAACGVSINASSLNTSITGLAPAEVVYVFDTVANLFNGNSASIKVKKGDILRVHDDGSPGNTTSRCNVKFTEVYRLG